MEIVDCGMLGERFLVSKIIFKGIGDSNSLSQAQFK